MLAQKVNYVGTKLLIDEVQKIKQQSGFCFPQHHMFTSLLKKINENSIIKPISKYGQTKLMAEKYLLKKKQKVKICIIRIFSFTNLIKKKFSLFHQFIKKF